MINIEFQMKSIDKQIYLKLPYVPCEYEWNFIKREFQRLFLQMKRRNFTLIVILMFLCTFQASSSSHNNITQCLDFKAGSCIACPYHYHLLQEQCYKNIHGCSTYGFDKFGVQQCLTCDISISKSDGKGGCTLTLSEEDFEDSSYFHQGSAHNQELRFYPMTLSEAQSNSFFNIVNSFMLTGEYKKYISQTVKPIQFVGILGFRDEQRLKIIYHGNGGGLIMCIFSANLVNNEIQMITFVQILPKNVINTCEQYDVTTKCLKCQAGYHLQNSICYPNIQDCISYYQNICLQCSGFSLLVQNRCVTNCCSSGMNDLSQIRFYGNHWHQLDKHFPLVNRTYLHH